MRLAVLAVLAVLLLAAPASAQEGPRVERGVTPYLSPSLQRQLAHDYLDGRTGLRCVVGHVARSSVPRVGTVSFAVVESVVSARNVGECPGGTIATILVTDPQLQYAMPRAEAAAMLDRIVQENGFAFAGIVYAVSVVSRSETRAELTIQMLLVIRAEPQAERRS